MQTDFHELTKESKALLFEINALYEQCNRNEYETTYAFQDKFIKPRKDLSSLEAKLNTLERFHYIKA